VSTHIVEKTPKTEGISNPAKWVAGFLLPGTLIGLLGSLPIVWQLHIYLNPEAVGIQFLAFNAGYVIAVAVAQRCLLRCAIRSLALFGCVVAVLGLLSLAFLGPPLAPVFRLADLGLIGVAGGSLTAALLYALEPSFSTDLAATASKAGFFFGSGCLLSTLIIGYAYLVDLVPWEIAFLAAAPLVFFFIFLKAKYPPAREHASHRKVRPEFSTTAQDLRSVAAFLFSLLLFVQFGNEWAIAGWLPIFLVRRLGSNPVWAIFALGGYFLALMLGRMASVALLSRVAHRKLLVGSVTLAMVGCLVLSLADSLAVASIAIVVIGASFAPVYPLVAEVLDERFSYHPGFYNGIFSVGITGAMSAPWLLSYVDAYLGVRYVMLLPACGSVIVFVLALLLMFEAHLMGNNQRQGQGSEPKTEGPKPEKTEPRKSRSAAAG
jgi:fucose permease